MLYKILLLLFMVMSSLNLHAIDKQFGTIVEVIDGDTVKIKNSAGVIKKMRLSGIDTPESYNNTKAKRDTHKCKILDYKYLHLGLSAKEFLQDMVAKNNTVSYKTVGYGRYHRDIVYIDGINELIVKNGWCIVKNYNKLSKDKLDYLRSLEQDAKDRHVGIWRYLKTRCY